ncbi:dephospho-CoA kinase [Spirochaetia bacterium]|nr:dephospho-CoA kinase [Spirochaetia bacterium]
MLIGLTGTYCAGKNHVAALLEQRGLPVLDVDKLGHVAIEAEKAAIFFRFGRELQKPDGTVDRRLLGRKVFGKPEELAALEAIVHPGANRLTDEWIAARNGKTCIINAALLHRSTTFEQLDRIILVTAPFFTRLLRARKRDGLSLFVLLKRFISQKDFTTQYFMRKADIYRVENRGLSDSRRLKAKLESQIDAILSDAILSEEGIF